MAEQDLARIKRNVAKMAEMGAPEEDIDGYIASEGTTVDAVRAFKFEPSHPEKQKEPTTFQKYVTQPIVQGFKDDADKVASFASQVGRNIPEGIDLAANALAATGNAIVGGKGDYFEGFMKPRSMPLSEATDAVFGEKYHPKTAGGEVAQLAGAIAGPSVLEGAAKGVVKAAPIVAGKAAKVVQSLKSPKSVSVAGEVLGDTDLAGTAKAVQDILKGQYNKSAKVEDYLWKRVRREAENVTIPSNKARKLQETLIDAQSSLTNNDSAGVVDRVLRDISRFAANDMRVPANMAIGWRRALSKASTKDASLRPVAKEVEGFLTDTLNVKSLPKAIQASTRRFEKFVDQDVVAKTIADEATPETVGKLLLRDGTQGAQIFDQVIKAAGKQAPEATKAMQQGIAHNVLSEGVVTYNRAGEAVVNKNALADNVFQLRTANKSLWNKLTTRQQEGLLALAANAKKSAEGNIVSNVARVVADFMGPKVSVVNRITGASEKLAPSQQMTIQEALELMKIRPPK